MSKSLKIKTRNCRIIANIIEKNDKEGVHFDVWNPQYCIGSVCRKYVESVPKLLNSKAVKEESEYFSFLGFAGAIKVFLGIDPDLIGYGETKLWIKYKDELTDSHNPSAKDVVKMLRNLASGEWSLPA